MESKSHSRPSGVVYFLISSVAGLLYYGLVFAGVALVGSQVGEGPSLGQVLAVSTTALVLAVACGGGGGEGEKQTSIKPAEADLQ